MLENADKQSCGEGADGSDVDYLLRAKDACAQGDAVLGMHLYLTAFEKAAGAAGDPSPEAVDALKKAWDLACDLKERSLAEYIFGKLDPFLSAGESSECSERLQQLALDKLEEFGLSRGDLQDVAEAISRDLLGFDAKLFKVEPLGDFPSGDLSSLLTGKGKAEAEGEPSSDGDVSRASDRAERDGMTVLSKLAVDAGVKSPGDQKEKLTYDDLAGYDAAVATMRDFGIGMQDDPDFKSLVTMLNARHGLDRLPVTATFVFRSPAREDAGRFVQATIGELKLPAMRMRMEENMQGMPVLCVMAQADRQPKLNQARNAFEEPAVLVIEDIDLWAAPAFDQPEDIGGLIMSTLSRGAREAVNLIRSSADDPDVFVLCTSALGNDVDPYFFDLLGPVSAVDIDYPTEKERADIWMEIAREHPSVRGVDRDQLVRFSQGMPRFDMHMAAREAIEEAYKDSLTKRRYIPVTTDNLFDKLAAYQPLDSPEYKALEQAVVDDFRRELDHLDDLLKGDGQ